MDVKITDQFDNKLLHRKEVKGWVSFAGPTPSNADIRLQLATKLSLDKELVVVDHIYNTYGAQEAKIFAKAYEKKDFLDRYEIRKANAAAPTPAEAEDSPAPAAPAPAAPAPAAPAPAAPASAAPAPAAPTEKPPEAPAEDKPSEGAK